jgi:hypothetical protein
MDDSIARLTRLRALLAHLIGWGCPRIICFARFHAELEREPERATRWGGPGEPDYFKTAVIGLCATGVERLEGPPSEQVSTDAGQIRVPGLPPALSATRLRRQPAGNEPARRPSAPPLTSNSVGIH